MSRPFRPPWFDHPVKSLACLLSLPYEKSLHSHPSGHSLTCSSVPFKLSTMTWRRTGEWRYISTHFLTSALDADELSASRPGRFTPKERASGTHRIGGWVGSRTVLDAVVKRKTPGPLRIRT
jgi:hypothetical protein